MQGILNGSKSYFLNSEISRVAMPSYPELGVDQLMKKCKDRLEILKYLPDIEEKRKVEKLFLWHILQKV